MREQEMQIAFDWCVENEKSTEFTIQYLMDASGCSFDEAIKFIQNQ